MMYRSVKANPEYWAFTVRPDLWPPGWWAFYTPGAVTLAIAGASHVLMSWPTQPSAWVGAPGVAEALVLAGHVTSHPSVCAPAGALGWVADP